MSQDGNLSPRVTESTALGLGGVEESPSLDLDTLLTLMSLLPDPSVPASPTMRYNNCYFAFQSTFRADVHAAIPGSERYQQAIVTEATRRWRLCDQHTVALWRQLVKPSEKAFPENPNSRKAGKPRTHDKAPGSNSHRRSRKAARGNRRGARSQKNSNETGTLPTASYPASDSPPPLIPRSPTPPPPPENLIDIPTFSVRYVPADFKVDPSLRYLLYYSDGKEVIPSPSLTHPYSNASGVYSSSSSVHRASFRPHGSSGRYYTKDNAYHDRDIRPSSSTIAGNSVTSYGTAEQVPMPDAQDSLSMHAFVDSQSASAPQSQFSQAENIFESLDTEVLNALWVELQM